MRAVRSQMFIFIPKNGETYLQQKILFLSFCKTNLKRHNEIEE